MGIIKYFKNIFTKKEKIVEEESQIGDEFYSIIKMTSGEEILSLTMIDDNNGDPLVILQNPITMKVFNNRDGMHIKVKPWIEMSTDDFFIIRPDKIITCTETNDERLIDIYTSYIEDDEDISTSYDSNSRSGLTKASSRLNGKSGLTKPSKKMGYIGSVEDSRKKLEDIFNNSIES